VKVLLRDSAAGAQSGRTLVPTRGTMLTPPSVQPVPPPDASGAERRPGDHLYFDGDIDFSDPQPRVDEETV